MFYPHGIQIVPQAMTEFLVNIDEIHIIQQTIIEVLRLQLYKLSASYILPPFNTEHQEF